MGDLLIRDLAPEAHTELKRRAKHAGMSLQAYVAQLLERSAMMPSLEEWLHRLEELPRHHDISGADAVRGARDEML